MIRSMVSVFYAFFLVISIFANPSHAQVLYQLDDDSSELVTSPLETNGAVALNSFTVKPGGETIISISCRFSSHEDALLTGSGTGRAIVYDDPDNDGNPNNAKLLAEVPFQIEEGHFDYRIKIPPTNVSGVFFIGIYWYSTETFTAWLEADNSNVKGRSWFSGDSIENFDLEDLPNNTVPPKQADFNYIIRAFSTSNAEPVPTVTEWGMIALSVLLIGSAAWFIRRRKMS